ncbi:MAG TPA: response regulator [Candidatus Baltobacteraceae bacterium]|jgi:two-component system chemotaxis sensor kinase CheA
MQADRAEALRARLLATFRLEAEEHLQTIAAELEVLSDDSSSDTPTHVETLFRVMHTLKGASRSVGLESFEAAAHRCESILRSHVDAGTAPDAGTIRSLREAAEMFAGFLAGAVDAKDLAQVGGEKKAAQVADTPVRTHAVPITQPATDVIRVEASRLDRLVVLMEDLLSPKLAVAAHATQAIEIAEEIVRLRETAKGEVLEGLRTLEARARRHLDALRSDQRALQTTIDDLYDELLRARLTPAQTILEAFPAMVRDLCRMTGKEVVWKSSGEHLEVDRKVLNLVKDPLIHMVRNAIDHGIESPEERAANGKPRAGNVSVTIAPADGNKVSIEVRDDGRGFAIDAIRGAALRSHLSTPDAVAGMSDAEVTELAFSAGVSTAPVVTTISGHGRGLAIVRDSIERVGGRVSTRSSPGKGTAIRLDLPASIVTYRALLVSAGGQQFLFPIESVERTLLISREDALPALEAGTFVQKERSLPFGSLDATLGLIRHGSDDEVRREMPALVVANGDRRGVVLVDDVIGEREIVVKPLLPPLRRVRNVLAAGLLGSGELVLVLRPLDVLTSLGSHATVRDESDALARPRIPRVLIVDDSITTRTMERNLFEVAGYLVSLAADGMEAWELLQTQEFDLIVSDIDMPRMDGFELTSRIRGHATLANLPVVLVTAREALEDRERGLGAGANSYVLKSGFDQTVLLEIVRRLL